jgi:hypothetical protein
MKFKDLPIGAEFTFDNPVNRHVIGLRYCKTADRACTSLAHPDSSYPVKDSSDVTLVKMLVPTKPDPVEQALLDTPTKNTEAVVETQATINVVDAERHFFQARIEMLETALREIYTFNTPSRKEWVIEAKKIARNALWPAGGSNEQPS